MTITLRTGQLALAFIVFATALSVASDADRLTTARDTDNRCKTAEMLELQKIPLLKLMDEAKKTSDPARANQIRSYLGSNCAGPVDLADLKYMEGQLRTPGRFNNVWDAKLDNIKDPAFGPELLSFFQEMSRKYPPSLVAENLKTAPEKLEGDANLGILIRLMIDLARIDERKAIPLIKPYFDLDPEGRKSTFGTYVAGAFYEFQAPNPK